MIFLTEILSAYPVSCAVTPRAGGCSIGRRWFDVYRRFTGIIFGRIWRGGVDYRMKLLSACRKFAFQAMSFLVHRSLGRGVRFRHTECVEDGVRRVWRLLPGQRPAGFMEN